MQPKVTKTNKTCFATNSSPALQQQIEPKELKALKRLQQHKLLQLHFEEFWGTLLFQIKHTTVKKLNGSQNALKVI